MFWACGKGRFLDFLFMLRRVGDLVFELSIGLGLMNIYLCLCSCLCFLYYYFLEELYRGRSDCCMWIGCWEIRSRGDILGVIVFDGMIWWERWVGILLLIKLKKKYTFLRFSIFVLYFLGDFFIRMKMCVRKWVGFEFFGLYWF